MHVYGQGPRRRSRTRLPQRNDYDIIARSTGIEMQTLSSIDLR